jgi:hypothetical protein
MPAVPSFPDVHVTGPVQTFIRATTSYNDGIFFLGTCEVTPQMQRRKYKANVPNEIAGSGSLPFQKTYDGEAATLALALSRFSKTAWGTLLEAGAADGFIPVAGSEGRWARGTPVYGEMTFEVWQVFENFFNPAGATENLEIGWYWPQVELVNHDTVKAGAQNEVLMLVLDCTPYWIPQADPTRVTGDERTWFLYSNDPDDFPDDVTVPQ